ncbi:unnamed protein product [Trichobilharzia szidati]|nr:unnamed protein product [Trichobilharzia szidati]
MSNQAATHCRGLQFGAFSNEIQDVTQACEINHSAEIIPCIAQLYRNELFSDVTLVVQNTHFPAHKAILAARSDYFRALFYGGMAESSSSVVHLNDINVIAFKNILRYMYTGQIKLKKSKLTLEILGLAHQYNFHSLESALSTYLTHSLCLKNVWCVFDMAVMYNLDGLITACLRFLDCLAPAPLCDPRFLKLSQSSVERLLSRDSFYAPEIKIFRAVCAWLKHFNKVNNETADKSHLSDNPQSDVDNEVGQEELSSEVKAESNNLSFSALLNSSVQQEKKSSNRDVDSDRESLMAVTSEELRNHHMMSQCVRFELMSLTELLTEVRSSKLVSSEELLDAINRQTNCPAEVPHRGWLLPGVNLASPRFGCTLISGEHGTYPHFFVENPLDLEESNDAKLNIESLSLNELNCHDSDYSDRNEEDDDAVDIDDGDEADDIGGGGGGGHGETYLRCQQQRRRNNDDDDDNTHLPTIDMSDVAGRTFNRHIDSTHLSRSSLSEGVVWGTNHTPTVSSNPSDSSHHTNNQRLSNTQQIHYNIRNLTLYGTGIVNTAAAAAAASSSTGNALSNKASCWIQPSSRRRVNQNKPPPPHSEYDVVRHSLDDPKASIIIQLGKPSIVNTIRMQLWDQDLRSYSYCIDVSLDQSTWHRIVDYRNYMCRSWQTLHFPSRVVHYIRITGTRNTFNRTFHLITFRCLYSENIFQQVDGFMVPTYNVANVDLGATVLEGVSRNRNALIDGNVRMYDWNSGYTCHQLGNGAIVVQLAQPFLLRSMRFLLWDLDPRTYSYSVYVSNDRSDWKLVRDASGEQCRSWQVIKFPLQLVTFIRVVGSNNTANDVFHLVHLECPYPPAETLESNTEEHSGELVNPTANVASEPNDNEENIVTPSSSGINQHDDNDNTIANEYQPRNSQQSPVRRTVTPDRIVCDSNSVRSESRPLDTDDHQSGESRLPNIRRPNMVATAALADYDLMPDLNLSSFPDTTSDDTVQSDRVNTTTTTPSAVVPPSSSAIEAAGQRDNLPAHRDCVQHRSFHRA